MRMRLLGLAAVAVALPTFALAAMNMGGADGSDEGKAFKDANDKMMQGMAIEPTGDADKDFVMMMIPHHQGAIDMAEIELRYGKDPELRKLADGIIAAQKTEIAQMRAWQAKHGG